MASKVGQELVRDLWSHGLSEAEARHAPSGVQEGRTRKTVVRNRLETVMPRVVDIERERRNGSLFRETAADCERFLQT